MKADWRGLLERFDGLRLLVIGDAMLDRYVHGSVDRLCREAPVPIVALDRAEDAPGGAANVAVNAAAMGASVAFVSLTGDDAEGASLACALTACGVGTEDLRVERGRRTIQKERLFAGNQMLLRLDQGSTAPASPEAVEALMASIARRYPDVDAVLISDYGYGTLTPRVLSHLEKLQALSPRSVFVDARDLPRYRALSPVAVKPNYAEAMRLAGEPEAAAGRRLEQVRAVSPRVLDLTGAAFVLVTLDADGAVLLSRDREPYLAFARSLPGARGVGAGDSFIAAFALAFAAGAPPPVAADAAAAAAAVAVSRDGTAVCSRSTLLSHLYGRVPEADDTERLLALVQEEKRHGRRIVFTNGCFDIVHSGHTSFLASARALGDVLVVGLNTDESVARLKGPGRPVNALSDRSQVLSALGCVDYVIPFEDDTPEVLLRAIRPEVFVKGGDYRREDLPEAALVESLGGIVRILEYVEDHSTTAIIDRISRGGARVD